MTVQEQPALPKPRLTVHEAAAVLKEHPQTTYNRLRTGQLKGVQYSRGGTWFIRAEDLEAFLNPPAPKRRRRRS